MNRYSQYIISWDEVFGESNLRYKIKIALQGILVPVRGAFCFVRSAATEDACVGGKGDTAGSSQVVTLRERSQRQSKLPQGNTVTDPHGTINIW